MCLTYHYSWGSCRHVEELSSNSCIDLPDGSGNHPNESGHHAVSSQDLGDPGYPCPACVSILGKPISPGDTLTIARCQQALAKTRADSQEKPSKDPFQDVKALWSSTPNVPKNVRINKYGMGISAQGQKRFEGPFPQTRFQIPRCYSVRDRLIGSTGRLGSSYNGQEYMNRRNFLRLRARLLQMQAQTQNYTDENPHGCEPRTSIGQQRRLQY